jgi:hypothetical protein
MEKITRYIIFSTALLFVLFSCNGKKEEQKGIITTEVSDTIKPVLRSELTANDPKVETIVETKDVKGVIIAPKKIKVTDLTSANDDGKFVMALAEIADSALVKIYPVKNNFSGLKSKLEKEIKTKGTFEPIESEENALLYKITFQGKEPAYNFLVFKKRGDRQYALTGEGEAPMTSITNQLLATKAYNTALSFVPAE